MNPCRFSPYNARRRLIMRPVASVRTTCVLHTHHVDPRSRCAAPLNCGSQPSSDEHDSYTTGSFTSRVQLEGQSLCRYRRCSRPGPHAGGSYPGCRRKRFSPHLSDPDTNPLTASHTVYVLDRLQQPSPDFERIAARAKGELGTSLEYIPWASLSPETGADRRCGLYNEQLHMLAY